MPKNLISFLIGIKNASLSKKKCALFVNQTIFSKFAAILYKCGIILSYNKYVGILKKKRCMILKIHIRQYNGCSPADSIVLHSKPSRYVYLTYKELAQLRIPYNKELFVFTNKGLTTRLNCLKFKQGGMVIFQA